jgi:enoyl-CoA hydratase/carnithine racemase
MSGTVAVERSNGIATLVMKNANKRNALDLPMLDALAQHCKELQEAADVSVVMLQGGGGLGFGAGADLDGFMAEEERAFAARFKAMDEALERATVALRALSQPIVAALEGPCFGGAVHLALTADVRIASSNMRLAIPAVSLGIVYPIEAIERLIALCGPARGKLILMTGRTFSAEEARDIGLVEIVAATDSFQQEVQALCAQIARQSVPAVRACKQIVDAIATGADPSSLRALQQRINSGEEARLRFAEAVRRRRERK